MKGAIRWGLFAVLGVMLAVPIFAIAAPTSPVGGYVQIKKLLIGGTATTKQPSQWDLPTGSTIVGDRLTVGGGGVPTTRTITAGAGLSGGGTLAADRTLSMPNVGPGAGTTGGGGNVIASIATDAQGRITTLATAALPSASSWASTYNGAATTNNTITYTPAGGAPSVRYDAAGQVTVLPGFQLQTQQTTTGGQDYYSPALQLTSNVWSGGNGWHNASIYFASTSEYASNAQNGANLSIYTRAVNNGSENILRKIFDLGRIDNGRTTQWLYSGNNSSTIWGIDDGAGQIKFGGYNGALGLNIMTANTTGIYVDTSQRVIVGNATSTTYKLDVLGTMHASGALTLDSTVSVGNTLTMGGNTGWITKSGGAAAVPPTITWATATLQNSWVAYGAPYDAPAYYKDAMGWVHVRGVAKTGTLNACVFTLPAGYRPINNQQAALVMGAGVGGVDVQPTGCFNVFSVAGGTNASMTVTIPPFYAEQ